MVDYDESGALLGLGISIDTDDSDRSNPCTPSQRVPSPCPDDGAQHAEGSEDDGSDDGSSDGSDDRSSDGSDGGDGGGVSA